jgi:hypothetical protein
LSFFEFLSKKLSTAAAPHRDDNLEKFAAAAPLPP